MLFSTFLFDIVGLVLCVLFLLLPLHVSSLSCDIDLGHTSAESVWCDEGCESCHFSMTTGLPFNGSINCLSEVPCAVYVDTDIFKALSGVYLDGQTASALNITTTGGGFYIWYDAIITAPGNRSDFRFESSSEWAVVGATFYAFDSGVVEFVFFDNGAFHEVSCMQVYASMAQKLSIVLETGTSYTGCPSHIECPTDSDMHPSCVWQSDATVLIFTPVVNLVAPSGTPVGVKMICQNPYACIGVKVLCHNEEDFCEMKYEDSEWYCDGPCAIPIKTRTTTLFETTEDSDKGNGGLIPFDFDKKWIIPGLLGACFLIFCCCALIVANLCGRLKGMQASQANADKPHQDAFEAVDSESPSGRVTALGVNGEGSALLFTTDSMPSTTAVSSMPSGVVLQRPVSPPRVKPPPPRRTGGLPPPVPTH